MPKKKGEGKFQGGGYKVLERGPVEVRRTLYDNGTVSYDGDHKGAKWRLVYRADDTVRLHFPHGFMRVFREMYGRKDGQDWANIDIKAEQR
jgi:hypothetical protein